MSLAVAAAVDGCNIVCGAVVEVRSLGDRVKSDGCLSWGMLLMLQLVAQMLRLLRLCGERV